MELVILKDKQAVTSSLKLAEGFNKQHKNVIQSIEEKIQSAENSAHYKTMFTEVIYKDSRGRNQKMYLMNQKGFTFIAMGFTGKKADNFKLKYIEAFEQMESHIKQSETIQKPITQTELLKMTAGSLIEMDTRVTELEENAPLSPGDYSYLSRIVNQKIRQVIAERRLNPNLKQRQLLYKELNGEVKKITGTPTRSQLRQRHFSTVTDFVRDWQPSNAALVVYQQLELTESEVG